MSDEAKKVVLARRAKFVAAALAGISVACGKERAPHPCLDVPPAEDGSPPTPQPCLTAAPPGALAPPAWNPESAPTALPEDASAKTVVIVQEDDPDAGRPHPCLTPRVCLSVLPPTDCEKPYWYDAQGVKRYKPQCVEKRKK